MSRRLQHSSGRQRAFVLLLSLSIVVLLGGATVAAYQVGASRAAADSARPLRSLPPGYSFLRWALMSENEKIEARRNAAAAKAVVAELEARQRHR